MCNRGHRARAETALGLLLLYLQPALLGRHQAGQPRPGLLGLQVGPAAGRQQRQCPPSLKHHALAIRQPRQLCPSKPPPATVPQRLSSTSITTADCRPARSAGSSSARSSVSSCCCLYASAASAPGVGRSTTGQIRRRARRAADDQSSLIPIHPVRTRI